MSSPIARYNQYNLCLFSGIADNMKAVLLRDVESWGLMGRD